MEKKVFTALFIAMLLTPTKDYCVNPKLALILTGIKQAGKVLVVDNPGYIIRCIGKNVVKPDEWKEPDEILKYDECCWVESHNSYTNKENGYLHKIQTKPILQQLIKYGVRSLDLRVWIDQNQEDKKKQLILSHGDPQLSYQKYIKPFSRNFPTLYRTFQHVKSFLDDTKNDKAIITIMLGATDIKYYYNLLTNYIIQDLGLGKKILSPQSDWDIQKNSGWPTLKYLRNKGKRIIIFADQKTYYTYDKNNYLVSNYWGFNTVKKHGLVNIGYDLQECKGYNANYVLKGIWDTTGDKRNKKNGPLHQMVKNHVKKFKKINYLGVDNVHLGNATGIAVDINTSRSNNKKNIIFDL